MQEIYKRNAGNLQENTHAKLWIQLRLYYNDSSVWLVSCKFAAYFQNTFLLQHPWMAASGVQYKLVILKTFMLMRISHLLKFLLTIFTQFRRILLWWKIFS